MINNTDLPVLAKVAAEAIAKLSTLDNQVLAKRWENAIRKAVRIMKDVTGNSPVTRANGGLIMLSSRASGRAYYASAPNDASAKCSCEAHKTDQPCWHIAAARLVVRHDERIAEYAARRA